MEVDHEGDEGEEHDEDKDQDMDKEDVDHEGVEGEENDEDKDQDMDMEDVHHEGDEYAEHEDDEDIEEKGERDTEYEDKKARNVKQHSSASRPLNPQRTCCRNGINTIRLAPLNSNSRSKLKPFPSMVSLHWLSFHPSHR